VSENEDLKRRLTEAELYIDQLEEGEKESNQSLQDEKLTTQQDIHSMK
jgi:hypothetical protein